MTSTTRKPSQPGGGPGAPAKKRMLNGIDTQALFDTIDAIKADPSKGSCRFFATTEWRGGTVSLAQISRYRLGGADIPQSYTIAADEPNALLGTDTAANPQMLLYAAINSCVMNTFVVNAAAKGIRLETLEIDLEGELDLRGFLGIDPSINAGYTELTLVCRVKGDGTPEQYAECLEAGTKYSPNFQTITRAVPVRYRVESK
jgi:uncharacterized OsmC-like protein